MVRVALAGHTSACLEIFLTLIFLLEMYSREMQFCNVRMAYFSLFWAFSEFLDLLICIIWQKRKTRDSWGGGGGLLCLPKNVIYYGFMVRNMLTVNSGKI